jgi:hypothetical protein
MPINTRILIEKAVSAAHLKGIETLNAEEFDALILMARGLGALRTKYAKKEMGLQTALMQEDILAIVGIPLPMDYLQQKKLLEEKIKAHKSATKKADHSQLDELYRINIIALRREHEVDQLIEGALNNEVEIGRARAKFTKDLSANFIEEDIITGERKPHESEAEYSTRIRLNRAYDKYNKKRATYLSEVKTAEEDYQANLQKLKETIQPENEKIKNKYEALLKQQNRKLEDLIMFFPSEKLKEMLKNGGFQISLSANEPARKNIEILVNQLYKDNHERLKDKPASEIEAFLYDEAANQIKEEQRILEAKKNAALEANNDLIKNEKALLNKKRKEKILKLKAKHKVELDAANVYFDINVLPLIKELKAHEAHKYFVVCSQKLSEFIEQHSDELSYADSNTIGFVSLLSEHADKLSKLGFMQHVGVDFVKKTLSDETKAENIEEGLVDGIVSRVAEKAGEVLGKEIASSPAQDSKKALSLQVELLERTAAVRVPVEIVHPQKTFDDFFEHSAVQITPRKKEGQTFFDFVDDFNRSKGVFESAEVAYNVYQALTTPRAKMMFSEQPPSTSLHLFANALQDEALAYNYKILMHYGDLLKVLAEKDISPDSKDKREWMSHHESIEELKESRAKLDQSFIELQSVHSELRKKYKKAESELHQAESELSNLKDEKSTLSEKINILNIEAFKVSMDYKKTHLSDEKIQSIAKKIEGLEPKYISKTKKLHEKLEQAKKIEKENLQKKLRENDSLSSKIILQIETNKKEKKVSLIKKAYEKEKGFFSDIFVTEKELEDFLERDPFLQAKVKKLEAQKDQEKAEQIKSHQASVDTITKSSEAKVNSLENKMFDDIAKLEMEKTERRNSLVKPYIERDKSISKIYKKVDKLKLQEDVLASQIEAKKEEIKAIHKSNLKAISSEFQSHVTEFNEKRTDLNKQVEDLLSRVLSTPTDEPHLRTMQAMMGGPHTKIKMLAIAANDLIPTIGNEVGIRAISYDEVMKSVAEKATTPREIKAVPKKEDERSKGEIVEENVSSLFAGALVEIAGEHANKVAGLYVGNMRATLEAEAALQKEQAEVNRKASDLLVMDFVLIEPAPAPVREKSSLSRFFGGIADFFRSIRNLMVGNKEEKEFISSVELELPEKGESTPFIHAGPKKLTFSQPGYKNREIDHEESKKPKLKKRR